MARAPKAISRIDSRARTDMSESGRNNLTGIGMSTSIHLAFFTMVVLFMGNLNALVDTVLHPDIP